MSGRPGPVKFTTQVDVVFNNFAELALITNRKTWYAIKKFGADVVADVSGGGPHAAPLNKKPPFVDEHGEDHPGALRRSYHYTADLGDHSVVVENDPEIADYAPFVEFGTVSTPAQPHFFPAVAYHLDKLYTRLKQIPAGSIEDSGSVDTGLPYQGPNS